MSETVEKEINADTLELVYQESRDAHAKLMADLDTLNLKADRIERTNLVMIGLIFGIVGSDLAANWTSTILLVLFLVVVILGISLILTKEFRPSEYTAGTIYPHILRDRLDEPLDQVKADLVDVLAGSYYHNNEKILRRGRFVSVASWTQLAAMGVIVATVVVWLVELLLSVV